MWKVIKMVALLPHDSQNLHVSWWKMFRRECFSREMAEESAGSCLLLLTDVITHQTSNKTNFLQRWSWSWLTEWGKLSLLSFCSSSQWSWGRQVVNSVHPSIRPSIHPDIWPNLGLWAHFPGRTNSCNCQDYILTDCMNLGTHVVTSSFKPASLNPKTASCTQF